MRPSVNDLTVSREPLWHYGSQEQMIRGLRDHRPLDLNAEVWRRANPEGSHEQWQRAARDCLMAGLHYDPGPLDLKSETLSREGRDGFVLERVAFNTTPWIRVNGYFLLPTGVKHPVPGLVVFHAWGGPLLFGKERIVNSGRDHPVLVEYRKSAGGKYLAEEFARAGYAVVVIDAFHFGERVPMGTGRVPENLDPYALSEKQFDAINRRAVNLLNLGVRELNWAGSTWMGLNYWDDSRCVDYLVSRPEVDPERIGCTGCSGGGWRTLFLAALDMRIRASVGVCWTTTGDYQQIYNLAGAIGTFCLLPGVWDRLDVPDLTIAAAPGASMLISPTDDPLFPPEGQDEAARQIREGYEWAGCPERFRFFAPDKTHCYDPEMQAEAIGWFDRHLKRET